MSQVLSLIDLIETEFKIDVYRQGSFTEGDEFPSSFFTFFRGSGGPVSNYDNAKYAHYDEFDINFFSSDPVLLEETFDKMKDLFITNGWQVPNYGRDMPSGRATHAGIGITISKTTYGTPVPRGK